METEEMFKTERLIFVAEIERLVALAGTDAEAHLYAQLWVFMEYMAQQRADRAGVVEEGYMVQALVVFSTDNLVKRASAPNQTLVSLPWSEAVAGTPDNTSTFQNAIRYGCWVR